jgi:hypothetical protein
MIASLLDTSRIPAATPVSGASAPREDEIAEKTAEIRQTWSEEERQERVIRHRRYLSRLVSLIRQ